MKKLLRLVTTYFFYTGIALQLTMVGLFLFKPPFYYDLAKRTEVTLRQSTPLIANILFGEIIQYHLEEEIAAAIPSWRPLDSSLAEIPVTAQTIWANRYNSLKEAAEALEDGGTLLIPAGEYPQGFHVKANHVHVEGMGHVVLKNAAIEGKGAIITSGNSISIKNIECHSIQVGDKNGVCVRHQGTDLTLEHVYFHNSQQGVLSGANSGLVKIIDSHFIQLGMNGRAHGLYIGSGKLLIKDSYFIAAKSEGHEIKSRAAVTLIDSSVIASLSSNNSRLVDIPNGGRLTIQNSILEQGPTSINSTAIGYGLEGIKHSDNQIELNNNLIILEKNGVNILLHLNELYPIVKATGNLIIAEEDPNLEGMNLYFKSRAKAGLASYPALPLPNSK